MSSSVTPNVSTARSSRTSCPSRSITQLVSTRTSGHFPEASCLQVPPTAGTSLLTQPATVASCQSSSEELSQPRENPDLRIIDLDRLKLERDSIWTAAYKAYLDGEPHVFSSYEISCIDETINGFTRDTPVYGAVVEALDRGLRRTDSTSLLRMTRGKTPRQCIVLSSLFEEMHVPVDRHSNMNIPVTDVLKQLGFKDAQGLSCRTTIQGVRSGFGSCLEDS